MLTDAALDVIKEFQALRDLTVTATNLTGPAIDAFCKARPDVIVTR